MAQPPLCPPAISRDGWTRWGQRDKRSVGANRDKEVVGCLCLCFAGEWKRGLGWVWLLHEELVLPVSEKFTFSPCAQFWSSSRGWRTKASGQEGKVEQQFPSQTCPEDFESDGTARLLLLLQGELAPLPFPSPAPLSQSPSPTLPSLCPGLSLATFGCCLRTSLPPPPIPLDSPFSRLLIPELSSSKVCPDPRGFP